MATQPATFPQQPGLPAFIVYDHVPTNCIAFPIVTNDTAPILRPGDVALVDTRQREPIDRELFVVEFGRTHGKLQRAVVEVWLRAGNYGGPGGAPYAPGFAWMLGAYSRPKSREEALARVACPLGAQGSIFCDGPYGQDGPGLEYLRGMIVGRIVGILEPRFAEPMRLTA